MLWLVPAPPALRLMLPAHASRDLLVVAGPMLDNDTQTLCPSDKRPLPGTTASQVRSCSRLQHMPQLHLESEAVLQAMLPMIVGSQHR
jgi:hypothetical protein